MTSNRDVIKAWIRGRSSNAGTLNTDGNGLYSYSLKIGEYLNGKFVVYDYTTPGGNFYSVTTSAHVNTAKEYADEILDFNVDVSNCRW